MNERVASAITARSLIRAGWRQVSSKHRILGWAEGDPNAPGADIARRMGRHKRTLTEVEFYFYKRFERWPLPRRVDRARQRCECGRFLIQRPSRRRHPKGYAIQLWAPQCHAHGEDWTPMHVSRAIVATDLPVPGP